MIRSLYVAPEHARKGIGRAMLCHLETQAAAARHERFELAATLNAMPMYRACGYAAVRPFLLALPDAEPLCGFVMTKSGAGRAAVAA